MKHSKFYDIFSDFLSDIYDAENQIIQAIPSMIRHATNDELRKGLSSHLAETEVQVERLEKIFNLMGESPKRKHCKGMEGLLEEGNEILRKHDLSPSVRDCFIIIAAQKVEHYEIASYGSAIALIKHITSACPDKHEYREIEKLLAESLKEEGHADKVLTKAAEGKLFVTGVNEELEEELKAKR